MTELLRWRPEHGVLSLYIDADPADRRASWRTEVKNGLRAALGALPGDADRDASLAARETAERLADELFDEPLAADARCVFGFAAVTRNEREERWYGVQVPPRRTEVAYGPLPRLHSLLAILDEAAPRGVATVSAERVRLFDWRLGRLDQLHDWGLELFAKDWRERKAQVPRDPASAQAVSAAGKDRYDQRLEHNRGRFAKETGGLAGREGKRRDWRELVAFGDERYVREFEHGLAGAAPVRHVEEADLISEQLGQIGRRLEELLPQLNQERERELIARIVDAALAGGRGAAGLEEVFQALAEGRVEHLVYDSERDYGEPTSQDAVAQSAAGELPTLERMVKLALTSSAAITPVEGESAERLAEHGGVAALLRY